MITTLLEKQLNLHGWVYDMHSGEIKIVKTERTGGHPDWPTSCT